MKKYEAKEADMEANTDMERVLCTLALPGPWWEKSGKTLSEEALCAGIVEMPSLGSSESCRTVHSSKCYCAAHF